MKLLLSGLRCFSEKLTISLVFSLVALLFIVGLGGAGNLSVRAFAFEDSQPQESTLSHRFVKVTDGIYHAIWTEGSLASNSQIIINEDHIVLVDSHATPRQAQALLADIKTLSDKPVRVVINTHFHFDHTHGNQVFGPEVQIIGHEYARKMLIKGVLNARTARGVTDGRTRPRIEALTKELATEADAEKKALLQEQLNALQEFLDGLEEVNSAPPNVTLSDGDTLTLYAGEREIQVLSFGPAHTGGDLIVVLPTEGIICTGDFLTGGGPFLTDAYATGWVEALEELKEVEFNTVLPGHGDMFTGRDRIEITQAYLRDVWNQVGELKNSGRSAQEAAKLVDMTKHSPGIRVQGIGLAEDFVSRMYELMDGKDDLDWQN